MACSRRMEPFLSVHDTSAKTKQHQKSRKTYKKGHTKGCTSQVHGLGSDSPLFIGSKFRNPIVSNDV